METPRRGMMRRPVGLLASTTTRAQQAPEAMGAVAAVAATAEEQGAGATLATEAGGTLLEHCARMKLPLVAAQPLAREALLEQCARHAMSRLVRVQVLPMAMAAEISHAHPKLPWAQVMKPTHCTSFGTAGFDEQLLESLQKRTVVVEAARAKTLTRKQITHYKCMSCRALVPNSEKKCPRCGYTRAEGGQLAILEREKERAASRQNTRKGRQRNKCSVAVAV